MTAIETDQYDVPLASDIEDFYFENFYTGDEWLWLSDYADLHPAPHARCGTHPRESIETIHINAAVCRMTGCLDAAH